MNQTDLCFLPATELAKKIRTKEISARDVMEAHLHQIEQHNQEINAIVTHVPQEQALDIADTADRALARGLEVGPLHGLPIAHKDLADTAGLRTTYGSTIFADHIPAANGLIIDRLQAGGAITIGKTNTPEFGAGSQTYNDVFGATKNPYDTSKTSGGSSGGAAAALASGFIPIADGSDMGGSLRNPASFCNVVGFRNTPGVVPSLPKQMAWSPIAVEGAMGRTVADVALMLSAIAGPDSRAPLSTYTQNNIYSQPLERDLKGVKIAWSRDFGDLPVDPRVTAVLEAARPTFNDLGCVVEDNCPDFTGADDVFKALRAFAFAAKFGPILEQHRGDFKDTLIWNTEAGLNLSSLDVADAMSHQTVLYRRVVEFMDDHDYEFMAFPVAQVPPFDVTTEYITEINGIQMETYIDWMKSCCYISALAMPAISVPAGFTPEGLPIGLQIVGRYGADFSVLQVAHAFEQATGHGQKRPFA